MLKPNWAAKRRISCWLLLFTLAALTACGAVQSATGAPTLTLIPAPDTPTPTRIPATSTRAALPGPADIATAAPSPTPDSDLLPLDPVAAELVLLAQRRLSDELDLPVGAMQVVEVEPYRWTDSSLGCPVPGQTYAPAEIDGYRIVLAADGREYLFHTDFDRAFPCDPVNERLPSAG